jgi:Xaa-Pro aminopeptidase
LVLARSSRDPCLACFAGPVKLGPSLVLAKPGSPPRLGYWTPMDREEAALSGLDLFTPEELDAARWVRDAASFPEILAGVASRALFLAEVAPGTVAVAGHWGAGEVLAAAARLSREGYTFAPGEPIVALLRKTKTAAEVDEVRRVARGTQAAFRRVAGLLAAATTQGGELRLEGERLSVGRLTREVASTFAEWGLEQPEGGICAPGREGAVPHTSGTPERVLRPGESLVLDLFPRGAYFADCTRTFCVGEPPEALRRAHARVHEALELARGRVAAGVLGWSLQEKVCEHLRRAGYPTPLDEDDQGWRGYVHGLGHGVGLDLHEYPFFREKDYEGEGVLGDGDVFTLEPGLYEPDEGWAVRLEDLHWLGGGGVENLTPLPYDLDPRAW